MNGSVLSTDNSSGVMLLQNWYEGQNRRIGKQELVNGQTVKTLYLYDGWDIVAVMNVEGQLREPFTRGVALAGDPAVAGLVAVTHHAGSWTNGTFYTHHNHRGDIVLTRSGTTTVGTYSYSAFGNLSSVLGPDICRFKFSRKELDRSTGFYYYGYRYYAPAWQRWPNPDPIGEPGFEAIYRIVLKLSAMQKYAESEEASDSIPISSLYAFLNNHPINNLDPFGLDRWDDFVCCLKKTLPLTIATTVVGIATCGVCIGSAGAAVPACIACGWSIGVRVWVLIGCATGTL